MAAAAPGFARACVYILYALYFAVLYTYIHARHDIARVARLNCYATLLLLSITFYFFVVAVVLPSNLSTTAASSIK